MIKKILFLHLLAIIMISAYACIPKVPPKPPKLDANQLRSLQVKEIDGDLDTCFKASLFILQDEGWIIKGADKSSGLIQAESLRTKSSFSPELDYLKTSYGELPDCNYVHYNKQIHKFCGRSWERWKVANVTLESWGNNTTKVRLSLVKKGFIPSKIRSTGGLLIIDRSTYSVPEKNSSEIIDDPTVYQNFFARLKKEVFVRQNLSK